MFIALVTGARNTSNGFFIYLLACKRASLATYENDLVYIFVLSIAVEVAVTSWHCSCSCSDSSSSRGSCCRILEDPSTPMTPRWTPTWRTFEEPWGQGSNEGCLVWCVCSATAIRFKAENANKDIFLTEDWHQSFRPLKIGILGLFSTFVWPILFWY